MRGRHRGLIFAEQDVDRLLAEIDVDTRPLIACALAGLQSERTVGAIEAYTAGAEISPRRGRWLWIPTDDIPDRVGKRSITPENYTKLGLATKIGPLVFVMTPSGRPLLVVKGASVSASGKSRSAKSLRKDGGLRKGQIAAETVVAFVGIRRTSRAARVDVAAIMRGAQALLPVLIDQQLGRR